MANDIKLQEGHPVDEHLRPLKVGGKLTAIEVAQHGNGAKITGDLTVTDVLTVSTVSSFKATDLVIDDSGDITLDAAGGDVNILQADLNIPATRGLYLDGGNDTYIVESGVDTVRHIVGGDILMILTEGGNSGNLIDFRDSAAGFTQHEPTFDADDTLVYFNRLGNKAFLTFDGDNITDLHLNFPNVSCNCVLLIKQDGTGSRTITNYKTFDEATGNESTVIFAGGSNPTLTTTAGKIDIISFYWDNDNHKAYGVATLNF